MHKLEAIVEIVARLGSKEAVGDMELQIEAEACGWEWSDIDDGIDILLDAGVLIATFGVDFMGRHEAAVRIA